MPEAVTPTSSPPVSAPPPAAAAPGASPPAAPPAGAPTLLTPTPPTDTGQKAGEAAPPQNAPKPGENAAPPTPVELKFPEGFKADESVVTGFKSVAQELGLKSEGAQKLADIYVKAEQARATAWQAETAKWAESTKADADYGGAKFDESMKAAQKAVAKFASPALKDLLNTSQLGNHPEVVRLMVAVGRSMAEDSVSGATGAGSQTNPEEARLRAMYPTNFK